MFGRKKAVLETTRSVDGAEVASDHDPKLFGRVALTGDRVLDALNIREEFHIQLIELADKFQDLDLEFGPIGDREIQDDCMAVRQLVRQGVHPRYHEALRAYLAESLDSQVLSGLVAGPDAE
jgi:hypothetical protein